MTADAERLLPPNEPAAFESLCLDVWREIWGDPNAQKNGRSGQPQAGVDVFGKIGDDWEGVQCKQKDGLLRTKLTVAELDAEVAAARTFKPKLSRFIVATSGPRDARVQERARELSEAGFAVQVSDTMPSAEYARQIAEAPALRAAVRKLGGSEPASVAAAVEFVLEGLHLSRKLNKDVQPGQTRYRS